MDTNHIKKGSEFFDARTGDTVRIDTSNGDVWTVEVLEIDENGNGEYKGEERRLTRQEIADITGVSFPKLYTRADELTDILTAFFSDEGEIFADIIESLDDWNRYLGDDRRLPMDFLEDEFFSQSPLELLCRAFYGRDEFGEEFNPNREYFYFNGYGNFISTDRRDYSDHLDGYAIEAISENLNHLDGIDNLPDEIREALEELAELV